MTTVWVCGACGKWWRGKREDARDVSCFMHAVECKENERTIGKERGMECDGWEAVTRAALVERARQVIGCQLTCRTFSAHDHDSVCTERAKRVANMVAEELERMAQTVATKAERLRHTSHKDGLGMGWQAGELLCEETATEIRQEAARWRGGERG